MEFNSLNFVGHVAGTKYHRNAMYPRVDGSEHVPATEFSNNDRDGDANFPFVNGRCHLKRSMPFLRTVVAI